MKKLMSLIFLLACFLLFQKQAALSMSEKAELVIQNGHTSSLESLSFSPDGSLLASGSMDNTVKIWSVSSGRLIHTFNERPEWIEYFCK